jgi:hypothetical protein
MEHAADAPGVAAQDGKGVVPRITLMDDGVEAEVGGEIELLAEEAGLTLLERGDFGGIFRQMVVIEADFAQGDNPAALCERAKAVDYVIGSGVGFAGMNADGGPDVGEIFGEFDGAGARIDPRADGDDLGHARVGRARDDFGAIRVVIGIIEMGVGVDEHVKL